MSSWNSSVMGIQGVNSNLATAIRTVVLVVVPWGMVFLTNAQKGIGQISQKSWLFLISAFRQLSEAKQRRSHLVMRRPPVGIADLERA